MIVETFDKASSLGTANASALKTDSIRIEVLKLEFAQAVQPITLVAGQDKTFIYPEIVALGSTAMNVRYPLQSFTVTPTGIRADKFTFTEDTRTIVLHGSDNFESLVGLLISLTLTLTN